MAGSNKQVAEERRSGIPDVEKDPVVCVEYKVESEVRQCDRGSAGEWG